MPKLATNLQQFLRRNMGRILRPLVSIRIVDARRMHAIPERSHLALLLPLLGVDCVFDIGANEGQYTRMLRAGAMYRGQVVSFEPLPEMAALLRKRAHKDPAWRIEELAVASSSGQREFNVMKGIEFSSLSEPSHRDVALFEQSNVPVRRISVETDTLTNVYRRLQKEIKFKAPFLKLDTQGYDVEILRAGADVMHNFVGFQSELAIRRLYRDSVDFRGAITFYRELGFELSALVPNNAGHFPVLVEMDCIMVRTDLLKRN